jgi:anti-anti-sigma regulatory factor
LIIDARAIPSIDITAAEQLGQFFTRLRDRGIEVAVVKAHLPLRETVSAMGVVLDSCWRFSQLADAVAAFREEAAR